LTGGILGLALVHWTGKRPLAMVSTLGTSLCFFVVSAYAYTKQYNEELILDVTWIPLVFLNTAAFMTHISIRLLPWMLIGEVIILFNRNVTLKANIKHRFNQFDMFIGVSAKYSSTS